MADYTAKFATVINDEHRQNCVRFSAHGPDGSCSLEYSTGTEHECAVWNIATDPPETTYEDWEIVDTGPNYTVVESEAGNAWEANDELEQLADLVVGDTWTIHYEKSFRMGVPDPQPVVWLKERLRGVLGGDA